GGARSQCERGRGRRHGERNRLPGISDRPAGHRVHLGIELPSRGALSAGRAQRRRRVACYFRTPVVRSKLTFPPTIVYTTSVVRMSSSGIVRMSFESTVISASFPGSSEPFSFSSNAAYALFSV